MFAEILAYRMAAHLDAGADIQAVRQTFFIMGGASSHDIKDGILEPDDPQFKQKVKRLQKQGARFRVNHQSWWKEEIYPAL